MCSSPVRRVVVAVATGVAAVWLSAIPAAAQTASGDEDSTAAEQPVVVEADTPASDTETSGSAQPVGDADEDGVFEPAPVPESVEDDGVMTVGGGVEGDGEIMMIEDPSIAENGILELAEDPADDGGLGAGVVTFAAAAAVAAAAAGTVVVRRRS